MKPIKKEDMPKVIVLIVLAVGVFVFGIVQFLSMSAPSVAAAPAAGVGTTVVASATGTGTGAASAQDPSALAVPTDPELDFLHIGPPVGGKDPFAQNGTVAPAALVVAPVPAPVVRPLPPVPIRSGNLEKLLGMNGSRQDSVNLDDLNGGKMGNPNPVVVELPAPAWNVSGIVLAERDSDGIKRGQDVAILRDGAGNRRFVTVGDPVDNGYHVSAVRPGGVEIRSKNRTTIIHLNSLTSNPSERPGTLPAAGINGATTRAN